jgi:hypothetical protein
MHRRARGRIAMVLQLGAVAPRSTSVTKEKGRRVTTATSSRRQCGPHLAEAVWERGRWRADLAVFGPKKGVGRLVGCRPTQQIRANIPWR